MLQEQHNPPGPGGASAAVERDASGEVRLGPLLPVPGLLREFGVDPAPVLAAAGLQASLFADAENRAPFARLSRLLELSAAASGCEHFGLLVGQQYNDTMLGVLSELARNSASVGAALDSIVLYLGWHDRGAVPVLLRLSATRTCLGYSINQAGARGATQVYDLAMAITCGLLRSLCGSGWRPTEVSLAHKAPRDMQPYARQFDAPVRFDAELSAVSFASRWLAQRIEGADAARHERIDAELRSMLQRQAAPLADKVQRALHMLIFAGTDTAPRLAHLFGLHERALRRRLADEGTSLQRIGSQKRFELAIQLLRDTELSAAAIAAALHYSDAAAFTRAFRGWAQTTPIRWRDAHRESAGAPGLPRGAP